MNITTRMPKFLRSIPFWSDFIEEIGIEIENLKLKIDEKKNFFNPRVLNTIESLRNLNRYFGFIIDTSLLNNDYNSDPDKIIKYLRSEANNMVFKIISKGTKNYHEYIFNRIQRKGYVYVMFFDSQTNQLYRALNYYDSTLPLVNIKLLTHDFSVSPFTEMTPLLPFASGFQTINLLDQGKIIDNSWSLDYTLYGASVSMTKHIAAEFMADRLYTVGTDTVLITNDYLEYLRKSLSFGRKATETPHIGLGITAYTTKVASTIFTIGIINIQTQVTSYYVSGASNPKNSLYSYFKLTSNALITYYKQFIVDTQIYQDDNFDLINISFPVSKSNLELCATGDGSTTHFIYNALYSPIEPKTIKINYIDTALVSRTIIDDGKGHLYFPDFYSPDDFKSGLVDITDFSIGVVDYTSGALSFDTIDTTNNPVIVTPEVGDINITYYNKYDFGLNNLIVYDDNDNPTVQIDFPLIQLSKKEYHVSFLIVIDKR